MLTTTGSLGRFVTSPSTNALATAAAVSHFCPINISSQPWPSMPNPVTAWLTATPDTPPLRAVSAAPMVPE